jgi:hypothetical protein
MLFMSNYYNGSVPMKPEMEKKDFVCEDDVCYQVPQVYFGCTGEVYNNTSAFDWNDEFVLVVRGNIILKYTESTFCETLVKDPDGEKNWMNGPIAELSGYDGEDVEDVIERKLYTIEEFDFDKFEKRRYKVVFEETLSIDDSDYCTLKHYVNDESEYNSVDYTLTE